MKKRLFSPAICLAVLFAGVVVFAQREPMPTDPNAKQKPVVAPAEEKETGKKRIREGTLFRNKRVFFRQTGSRTTVYEVEGNERFVCLENLNLERILKTIEEKPTRGIWKIDGVFTEFRGENFVLIQKAVVSPVDFTTPDIGKTVEKSVAKEAEKEMETGEDKPLP